MIVIEEDPDVKVRAPTSTLSHPHSHSLPPPPAYTPPPNAVDYGSTSTSSSGASVLQYPDDVPLRRDRFPRGENARKWFIKAFLLALAHFALIAFIARRLSGVLMNVDWTKKVSA